MDSCRNCEHAIFDEIWGEYKCMKRCVVVYPMRKSNECDMYKKKKERKRNDQT